MSGFIVACVMLCPAAVLAHSGHGTTSPTSIEHYVFEPVHALPAAVLLAGIGVLWYLRQKRRSR